MVDCLVQIWTRERRVLTSAGRVVSDNQMIPEFHVGLTGSFPKAAEFLVKLQNLVQALGCDLDFRETDFPYVSK